MTGRQVEAIGSLLTIGAFILTCMGPDELRGFALLSIFGGIGVFVVGRFMESP